MTVIEPMDPDQFDERLRQLDAKARQYTQAPGVTNYVRAAAHHPGYLSSLAEEHLVEMVSDKLRRQTKETLALAVSMTNGCGYCSQAHGTLLKKMFKLGDADLVEVAAVTSHYNALASLEAALQIHGDGTARGRFAPLSEEQSPILAEIREVYPDVPVYFRIIAQRPEYLRVLWGRERAVVLEAKLDRDVLHLIGLAVSATRGAAYGVRWHGDRLEELGMAEDTVLEAIMVCQLFNMNNTFTQGLQLEMGLWGGGSKPTT